MTPAFKITCHECRHYKGTPARHPRYIICSGHPKFPTLILPADTWRHCIHATPYPPPPQLNLFDTPTSAPQGATSDLERLSTYNPKPARSN